MPSKRNTEILEQLGRQIKLLQTNRPMVPVQYSAKQVRCWICGKLGHIKRNCTARMTGGSNSISEGAVYVSGIINDKETKKDSYPLPCVDDLLDDLPDAKWFSTILS